MKLVRAMIRRFNNEGIYAPSKGGEIRETFKGPVWPIRLLVSRAENGYENPTIETGFFNGMKTWIRKDK